ncbi:unnamed protein product [Microthlaspi erraticum]|uniref:Uncharacterized protein n=1 Tax=Microthlaspi erraticum TaxID=1685480 RepID=A0A6D2JQT0_9BRAS|nr:unnamed protein product [Microthlaspi erraticum]
MWWPSIGAQCHRGDHVMQETVEEWRHAINVLTSYAIEFSGMEDKILPLLKYSYDNLKGEDVKSCLLYCALFPEDDLISKKYLIDYLIGEGIIDGSEGIERAENKGCRVNEIPKVKNWNSVRRMSLMKNKIRNLAGSPECLELTAFLMQRGELVNISSEFFKSMPKLQILVSVISLRVYKS